MEAALFEKEILDIVARVEALREQGARPVVIGLDGMAASGKTTLAALLEQKLDAAVIHMDDFFLPQGFRTPKRLKTPGGNVYHERFREEVVPYLRCGELFGYRIYDGHRHCYVGTRLVEPKDVILVEGCYCMHPALGEIYDLRLFCAVSPSEQMRRITASRPERAEMFKAMWIPMENRYHEAFDIPGKCDMVITSGEREPAAPLEIERKFLIRMPDRAVLAAHATRTIEIEQVYLTGAAPGVSVRIRKAVEKGVTTYYKTEKQKLSNLVRVERENVIHEKDWNILLGFADPGRRPICKTRYCVPMEGGFTAEIDLFPFWTDRAFCEVELPAEDTPFTLPDWLEVVRDVTEDKRYTNAALAKEIPTEEL